MEKGVVKTAWRFGYGRRYLEYPIRFSFIYDYCYYHDLIIETDTHLKLSEKGLNRITMGGQEDLFEIFKFWLWLYKKAIPNLQSIAQWIDCLTSQWIVTSTLSHVLCPLIKPFFYDSAESIISARIIQMMMHLGLVCLGEDHIHGMVMRITPIGSKLIQSIDNDKTFLLQSLQT